MRSATVAPPCTRRGPLGCPVRWRHGSAVSKFRRSWAAGAEIAARSGGSGPDEEFGGRFRRSYEGSSSCSPSCTHGHFRRTNRLFGWSGFFFSMLVCRRDTYTAEQVVHDIRTRWRVPNMAAVFDAVAGAHRLECYRQSVNVSSSEGDRSSFSLSRSRATAGSFTSILPQYQTLGHLAGAG